MKVKRLSPDISWWWFAALLILCQCVGESISQDGEPITVETGSQAADAGTQTADAGSQTADAGSQTADAGSQAAETGDQTQIPVSKSDIAFKSYLKLFDHNRAIQLDAVKSIQTFGTKYEQRYKLVDTLVKQLFKVLEEANKNLTEFGYIPGDPFPENETIREMVSKVLENTALFGDLILRIPDITHAVYSRNKDWEYMIGWAVWFSMESGVFQDANEKLLNLMSQELGMIPKTDDYVNPYREGQQEEDSIYSDGKEDKPKKKKPSKAKKPTKKGPRLSGVPRTEL